MIHIQDILYNLTIIIEIGRYEHRYDRYEFYLMKVFYTFVIILCGIVVGIYCIEIIQT